MSFPDNNCSLRKRAEKDAVGWCHSSRGASVHSREPKTTRVNNNGRNGSFFYVAGYLIEERRRWPVRVAVVNPLFQRD